MRHHVIISGTGRAGTTFLVQLLTALKLDTGFSDTTSGVFPGCNAGMEFGLSSPESPYYAKSPWFCDYLDDLIRSGKVVIDHAIVPMRDLFAAAESRREIWRTNGPDAPGGLWHTDDPALQDSILAIQFHKLLHVITEHQIPLTLLAFPRLVRDADYLYSKLGPLLPVDRQAFHEAFHAVSKPELVHNFMRQLVHMVACDAAPHH